MTTFDISEEMAEAVKAEIDYEFEQSLKDRFTPPRRRQHYMIASPHVARMLGWKDASSDSRWRMNPKKLQRIQRKEKSESRNCNMGLRNRQYVTRGRYTGNGKKRILRATWSMENTPFMPDFVSIRAV